jgi:UDP:flavonoid glycosyltransferase YjiC (YdhE family)
MYPLLPLASAARDAGHDVDFATDESFHPVLREIGAEPVEAGMPVREGFQHASRALGIERRERGDLSEDELRALVAKTFGSVMPERFVDQLTPVLERERPGLVVAEAGNVGAAFAARLAAVPVVLHGFGRAHTGDVGELIGAEIQATAGRLGVTTDELTPFLDIYPPSLQDKDFLDRERRYELRPVPFSAAGELPGQARDDRPRPLVYLTLGTAFGEAEVLRQAIEGLAGLDVDVLVAAGPQVEVAAIGDVPANVTVHAWVPQGELLPYTDLVVHHGGSGTTLGTAGVGVPQLFLPRGADQFVNADAVVEAGAGDRLLPVDVSAEAVAAKAKRLLVDDDARAVARELAGEIAAMPSPEDMAKRLPEFTRG